jgi:hypothetical protein
MNTLKNKLRNITFGKVFSAIGFMHLMFMTSHGITMLGCDYGTALWNGQPVDHRAFLTRAAITAFNYPVYDYFAFQYWGKDATIHTNIVFDIEYRNKN